MEIDGRISGVGIPAGLSPAAMFTLLNDRRADLDRRLINLSAGNPAREILWLDLEPILNKMREVVEELARSRATHLPEVQAKAAVLAAIIRPDQEGGGAVIPDKDISALVLSLTDDIASLTNP